MVSVKKQIVSGVFYTAISKYTGILVSLCVTAILARLLTPDDFGVVAIASVLIAFFDLLCNMGFGPAIIQHKGLRDSELSDIFSFTVLIGTALAICFFFLAKPISHYYKNDLLINLCQLISLNLVFISFNIVPNALLLKDKQFKFLSICNLCTQAVLGGIAIFCAYSGLGIYSLLITPIGSSFFVSIANYIKIPVKLVLSLKINFHSIRKILSFSLYQFCFNIVNYFSRNLDKLLIGKYIGMRSLGYYEKSYRVMMLPLSNITHVITPTIQPILSDFQDQKECLLNYSIKLLRILALIGCILTPFLFFSARELILILFGDQWVGAIQVFKLLSLSVFIQMVDSASGSILQSSNSAKYLFISGLICAVINVFAILISVILFKKIEIVAVAIDIAFALNLAVSFYYIFKKTFNAHIGVVLRIFGFPVLIGLMVTGFLFWIPVNSLPLVASLLIKLVVTVVVTGIFIQLTGQYDFRKLGISLRNLIKQ
ncbi:MAG: lipopolysaccharide biosynthesis protein [Bacteroidales bacterium]